MGKEGKEGQKEKVDPDKTDLIEKVWSMAAPKIRMGVLKAIFIECSYDNSRDNEYLYGHLKPNLLMEELRVLAEYVKKTGKGKEEDIKPNTRNDPDVPDVVARASTPELEGALQDLKVVIIHMKERFGEGESIKKLVERELAQLEQHHKLGCKFIISKPGMSLKF